MAGLSGAQAGGAGVVRDPGEGLAADDAQQGPVAVEGGPEDEHVGVQEGPAVGRVPCRRGFLSSRMSSETARKDSPVDDDLVHFTR